MTESMCEGCHSGCCRAFAVPITGADILRIERRLGLDFWEFACRWADPAGRIARAAAPHFRFEDDPQTPFVICLKHERSEFYTGTTRCGFLIERPPQDGQLRSPARCGIYESRPAACRSFPGKWCDDRQLVVLGDVSQTSPRDGDPVYGLCPRPWAPHDVDPVQFTQDVVVMQHELEFFRHIASVWNRTAGAWRVFPEFLRGVYGSRVVSESSQDAEEEVSTIPFPRPSQIDSLAA